MTEWSQDEPDAVRTEAQQLATYLHRALAHVEDDLPPPVLMSGVLYFAVEQLSAMHAALEASAEQVVDVLPRLKSGDS